MIRRIETNSAFALSLEITLGDFPESGISELLSFNLEYG